MSETAKIFLRYSLAALLLGLLPVTVRAQASSPHFILKKSTFGAAGSKALTGPGNMLRLGASAAQDSPAGKANSPHFVLRAGFWGPQAAGPSIPGDCDGNGAVAIGEVQRAISMFLGTQSPACGVDCNGDGTISIGEVQKVINVFLGNASSC